MIDGFCKNLAEKLNLTAEQLNFIYANYDIHCLVPSL